MNLEANPWASSRHGRFPAVFVKMLSSKNIEFSGASFQGQCGGCATGVIFHPCSSTCFLRTQPLSSPVARRYGNSHSFLTLTTTTELLTAHKPATRRMASLANSLVYPGGETTGRRFAVARPRVNGPVLLVWSSPCSLPGITPRAFLAVSPDQ